MDKLSIVIFGAAGRVGQAIIKVLEQDDRVTLGAAIERDDHPSLGQSVAGSSIKMCSASAADLADCAALIAFPTAEGAEAAARCASDNKLALVMGTTGLTTQQHSLLEQTASKVPVLWSANMSLGICVLTRLVSQAAQQLAKWDVEILDLHHRHKVDAPSGTALHLGEAVRKARNQDLPFNCDRGSRQAARTPEEIGMAVMRAGDTVGEHTVFMTGNGERIELTHRALSRHNFAYGAVHAAITLVGKPAGIYQLDDLLANH